MLLVEQLVIRFNLSFIRCVIGAYKCLVRNYNYKVKSTGTDFPLPLKSVQSGMLYDIELNLVLKLGDYERGEISLAGLIGWYEGFKLALLDIKADKCNRFPVKNGMYYSERCKYETT